jgi:hypothetical protein
MAQRVEYHDMHPPGAAGRRGCNRKFRRAGVRLFFPAQKLFYIKSHPFVHINQKFSCYFSSDKVIVASLGLTITGLLQIGTFYEIHRPFRARCIFKLFWRSGSISS